MEASNSEYMGESSGDEVGSEIVVIKRKVILTYIILGINLIFFSIMMINDGRMKVDTLINFGGKYAPLIWKGEWWRLITSIFLHANLTHVAFNSYALFSLGQVAEILYGRWRFLFIYFAAGLWGSIASTIWGFQHVTVGASGAIFGLAGSLLYFGFRTPKIFSQGFGKNLIFVILFNLLYGFTTSGMDNYAHIGGLAGGFMAAGVLGLSLDTIKSKRFVGILLFLTISLGSAYFIAFPPEASWPALYTRGNEYLDSGEYSQAVRYLTDAYDLDPGNPLIERSLGIAQFEMAGELFNEGRYKEAIEEYEKCRSLLPDEPAVEYNMGLAHLRLNSIKEGLDAMRRALIIDPNFEPAKRILRSYGL